jgi:3-oxoacyl-[acyl-carrier-protein] synthase III
MTNIRAAITGVGGYVPDYILNNEELSRMVETSDEWIIQRVGIKERRILKDKEKATSDMAVKAIENLLEKTHTLPEDIDLLLCPTITPDLLFPATSNIIAKKAGLKNAFNFDISAACSGFIYGMEIVSRMIESGAYKKAILLGAEKMSSIVDYTDRATSPLFGDGAAAVLVEPTTEELGIFDRILGFNGNGIQYLHMKAGGSLNPTTLDTVERHEHFVYQEGKTVYRFAVSIMSEITEEIMKRNNLTPANLDCFIPHQANLRIIESVGKRLSVGMDKVLVNIDRYGNTTSATIPLCLWDFEKQLKKGDNVVLTAFGAGFTWGTIYLKWAYDPA